MTSLKNRYAELIALAELYVRQEHKPQEWLTADLETYTYFKNQAASKRPALQTTPPPASKPVPASVPLQRPLVQPQVEIPQSPQPQAVELKLSKPDHPKPALPPSPQKIENPSSATVEQPKRSDHKNSKRVEREPLGSPGPVDLSDVRKIIAEKIPGLKTEETIPPDTEAKQISNGWQRSLMIPEVLVLSFNEPPKQLEFLTNMTKAIEIHLAPVKMVSATRLEETKEWDKVLASDQLRLIIASNYGLYTLPELTKHIREVPKQAKTYLGNVPVYLLSDISLYMQEPKLKASLWKALCETLKKQI